MEPNYDFVVRLRRRRGVHRVKPAGSGLTYPRPSTPRIGPEAIHNRGGKLILYHGFADPFVTPLSTLNYYNRVVEEMNGLDRRPTSRASSWCRHEARSGGPGPRRSTRSRRSRNGWSAGPDSILATHLPNAVGPVQFTRPLCPSPGGIVQRPRRHPRRRELLLPGRQAGRAAGQGRESGDTSGKGKVTISAKRRSLAGSIFGTRRCAYRRCWSRRPAAASSSAAAAERRSACHAEPGVGRESQSGDLRSSGTPSVRIEVKERDAEKGPLEVSLKIERPTPRPAAAPAGSARTDVSRSTIR